MKFELSVVRFNAEDVVTTSNGEPLIAACEVPGMPVEECDFE